MAENLDTYVSENGSICFDFEEENCNQFGRLYDWATAMGFDAHCNTELCTPEELHRGICPSGWHIPSAEEWNVLVQYVDPATTNNTAGTKLKAKSWTATGSYKTGEDIYGFKALPGGYRNYNVATETYAFTFLNSWAQWWTASETSATSANYRYTATVTESLSPNSGNKLLQNSVRCIKDPTF
jgi:uncharacterized protein (TIGR02145 family)